MKYPSIQPNLSSFQPKQSLPSPSPIYNYPPLMPSPRTMNIPVLQSRNSLTTPRDGDDSLPFLLNTNMESTDQIMDTQIQLQQDMLYQNAGNASSPTSVKGGVNAKQVGLGAQLSSINKGY